MATRPFYELVGGELRVNLHAGQTEAFDIISEQWDTFRVLLVLAGWQSGKTLMGPTYLHYCMAQRAKEGHVGTPGEPLDFIAASATYDVLRLKMLPALEEFFCRWRGWGKFSASDRIIYSNDKCSRIVLRSADSGVGLESFTAMDAWADEWGRDEVDITKYESMMRGLSVNQGHLLITTTAWNLGWTKICIYDPAMGGSDTYKVVSFPSIANPSFPRAEWDRARESMPDWKFQMRYEGRFVKPAGVIYTDYIDSYAEFDEKTGAWTGGGNLVKAFSVPSSWLRDVGVDFGEADHCARIWAAEDPTTHYHYIYRDQLGGGLTGAEYAREAVSYKEAIREVLGGAKSENDWRLKWALAGVAIVEPRINDVEAGIDQGNALFKQRRMFVMDTCTGLRSELATYSRELDAAGEPTAKIADKQKFHRCVTPDTRVNTRRGCIPISEIVTGDSVMTRAGWKNVTSSAITSRNQPIYRLDVDSGDSLKATGDHPVWCPARGWVPLDALRYGDIILMYHQPEAQAWKEILSSSKECVITDTQTRRVRQTGTTICPKAEGCTARFGRLCTGLSRTVTAFIIRTAIRLTTISRILCYCIRESTTTIIMQANVASRRLTTWNASDPLRLSGIGLWRVGNGIATTQNVLGQLGNQSRSYVTSAANITSQCPGGPAAASVQATAKLRGDGRAALTTLIESVPNVAIRSEPTSILPSGFALTSVLRVVAAGSSPVWNLTIQDVPEFVAGGILVHNCDAYRYLASRYPLDAPVFTRPVIVEIGGRTPGGIRRRAKQYVENITDEYR